jgi:hypothetical protein
MSDVETDLDSLSNSDKLTHILAQIATINTYLDSHGKRLALLEKTVTDQAAIIAVVAGGVEHSGAGSGSDQVLPAGSNRANGVGGNTFGAFSQSNETGGGTVLPTG